MATLSLEYQDAASPTGCGQTGERRRLRANCVGPNSPNPGLKVFPRDLNNFGPAVGFALNLDNRTTVRGGYQLQYVGGDDFSGIEGIIGNPPGSIFFAQYAGDTDNPYLDLTKITGNTFPIKPPTLP